MAAFATLQGLFRIALFSRDYLSRPPGDDRSASFTLTGNRPRNAALHTLALQCNKFKTALGWVRIARARNHCNLRPPRSRGGTWLAAMAPPAPPFPPLM
jgi:hypothetical protein